MMVIQLKKITVLAFEVRVCGKNINGSVERRFFKLEKIDKGTLLPIIQNEIELRSMASI